MDTVAVTSKHQITIPATVRRSLNLQKGDRLAFESGAGGAYQIRKVVDKKSDGAAVPYLGKRPEALSADAMAAAIGRGAVASWHRSQS
jgi:AbrB family looped-hinge helix DNA binding protein